MNPCAVVCNEGSLLLKVLTEGLQSLMRWIALREHEIKAVIMGLGVQEMPPRQG